MKIKSESQTFSQRRTNDALSWSESDFERVGAAKSLDALRMAIINRLTKMHQRTERFHVLSVNSHADAEDRYEERLRKATEPLKKRIRILEEIVGGTREPDDDDLAEETRRIQNSGKGKRRPRNP